MRLPPPALSAALLACAMLTPAAHADAKTEMEAVMAKYLESWNAHDAAVITSTYYRLDSAHPWSTEAGMKAEFERLKAQGYDKSEISGVRGCALTEDTGQVELRYTRLKADGSFMPPKDRASIYRLHKFEDGWRITSFAGLAADQRMDCPAD